MTNVQASEFRSELLDTSVTSCQTTQIRPRSLYTLTDDSSYYNCQVTPIDYFDISFVNEVKLVLDEAGWHFLVRLMK